MTLTFQHAFAGYAGLGTVVTVVPMHASHIYSKAVISIQLASSSAWP